jgi:hypothetical protein
MTILFFSLPDRWYCLIPTALSVVLFAAAMFHDLTALVLVGRWVWTRYHRPVAAQQEVPQVSAPSNWLEIYCKEVEELLTERNKVTK